jgi:O-antigen ligase
MKFLLIVYLLFSGVTWVAGAVGVGLLGRIALPDLAMVLLIALVLVNRAHRIRIPKLATVGLLMVAMFSLGVLFSKVLLASTVEWLVHLFLVVGFIAIYNVVASRSVDERVEIGVWWVRATVVLAVVGIYDLVALIIGLPGIAASFGHGPDLRGGLVSTFRNAGQAGSFFVTGLFAAIPLQRILEGKRRTEMTIAISILVLAVILSVKRAALISLVLGLVLIALRDWSFKGLMRTFALVVLSSTVVVPVFRWMSAFSESFEAKIARKLSSGAVDQVAHFVESNFGAAIGAFIDHPLLGVGLGGIAGVYTETYEIHSTYFSVLAQTGVVGTIAYLWFVFVLFRSTTTPRNDDPRVEEFARLFLPLLFALFVSYAYTYHLRKREFWITAALASALMAPVPTRRVQEAPVEPNEFEKVKVAV